MSQPIPRRTRFHLQDYVRFAHRYARHSFAQRREPPPVVSTDVLTPNPAEWPDDHLTLAWLGHSTVLMNYFGTWLITDPVLGHRIGVNVAGVTLGPRRLSRPALTSRDIPPIDLVLLSHAHMDHLDLATLRRFPRSTRVVTHRGIRDLLRRFTEVDELRWGERVEHEGLSVEAIGARHWGARTIHDRQRGFGGFILRKLGRTVLYAGDTAYTDQYRAFAGQSIDLAILPIGAYDPWIANHASPEEAWAMGREMNAHQVLGVHHSTFRLSREPMDEPLQRFLAAAGGENWRVAARAIGETWNLSGP